MLGILLQEGADWKGRGRGASEYSKKKKLQCGPKNTIIQFQNQIILKKPEYLL